MSVAGRIASTCGVAVAVLCSSIGARGASFGDGPKLADPDATGGPQQGWAVALSSDGTTALVGGPGDASNLGAAWVFTRSGGRWSLQHKLVGTGVSGSSAEQGSSVALSSDGNMALVGAPLDGSGLGAAWVFTRAAGAWSAGTKLVPTNVGGPAHVGSSVALSSDGSVAILGAPGDIQHAATIGAALVFSRSGGTWTQTAKLFGNVKGSPAPGSQGTSVALSSDGATVLVGAPTDTSSAGAVWVFVQSNGAWSIQQELLGTGAGNESGAAQFGFSVALSSDGATAIVGGPDDASEFGASWIFTRSGSVWSLQGGKLVGSGASGLAKQGHSVALSADGNEALVGGPNDGVFVLGQIFGAAWAFARDAFGTWSQQGDKLLGWGRVGSPKLGWSVALAGSGEVALLGGPYDGVLTGATWVFSRSCVGPGGDVNGDGLANVSDVFYLINFLFAGGPVPVCR